MDCACFRSNIFSWSENDFSSFSVDEFETHSKECVECSFLLEEFSKTIAVIEKDKLKEADPYAETRLLAKLEDYREAKIRRIPVSAYVLRPVYLGIGIVVAILLGVVMGFEENATNRTGIANNNDIESFRLELNVPDIMEDDVIQFSNQ